MTIEIPIWLFTTLTYCGYGIVGLLCLLGIMFLKMMCGWTN